MLQNVNWVGNFVQGKLYIIRTATRRTIEEAIFMYSNLRKHIIPPIKKTRNDSDFGDYLPPFGLIIKGAIIGYILLVILNYAIFTVFFGQPTLYWWLFYDDILATLGFMVFMTVVGIILFYDWKRYKQR